MISETGICLTHEAQQTMEARNAQATAEAATTQTQQVVIPTFTPTPEWKMIDTFNEYPDDVFVIYVPRRGMTESKHFVSSDCPIDMAGFHLDLMVTQTSVDDSFSAHLDLHGVGVNRSWYAQIGYAYSSENGLRYFCQAYSYSSDVERFWWSPGPAAL
jgi:hypothetical protein